VLVRAWDDGVEGVQRNFFGEENLGVEVDMGKGAFSG
jgi:hypothetical protein